MLPGVLLCVACVRAAPLVSPLAFAGADTVRVTDLARGVRHLYVWDGRGPWAIHVLEIEAGSCRPMIRARKAGPPMEERRTVSALAPQALAAINADFFALPGGSPVGPHVDAGEVIASPSERPALTVTRGRYDAGRVVLNAFAWAGADTIAIDAVNRPAPRGVTLLTRWVTRDGTAEGRTVSIIPLHGMSSSAGLGIVQPAGEASGPDALRLVAHDTAGSAWIRRRSASDTVAWRVVLVRGAEMEPVEMAVGGYPRLLEHGRAVLHEESDLRPEFALARHPRTAVGWSDGGLRAWWVVVDGRQAPYSDGMTLPELATLLARIGAAEAINLDGGGSSTMVVGGRVRNRPSDREGERAVGNALVLEQCGNGRT